MAQLFVDQLHRARGARALVRLWLRTLADLLLTLPVRYFERPVRPGMFRLYNEPARRSIFFARCAAARLGHASITAEDLLAGLIREDREVRGWFRPDALDEIRHAISVSDNPIQGIVSRDPLLSETVKQILSLVTAEAERTGTKKIVPRHLAAGIFSQGQTLAADLLRRHVINPDQLRIPPE
jgi:ATP-dependent Clp protease ATP-binding subunit ClpA